MADQALEILTQIEHELAVREAQSKGLTRVREVIVSYNEAVAKAPGARATIADLNIQIQALDVKVQEARQRNNKLIETARAENLLAVERFEMATKEVQARIPALEISLRKREDEVTGRLRELDEKIRVKVQALEKATKDYDNFKARVLA